MQSARPTTDQVVKQTVGQRNAPPPGGDEATRFGVWGAGSAGQSQEPQALPVLP